MALYPKRMFRKMPNKESLQAVKKRERVIYRYKSKRKCLLK